MGSWQLIGMTERNTDIPITEFPITSSIPFMKERDVLLLYSGDNCRLARYAVRNGGELWLDFFRRRLTLINLPELLSGISEGILSYFFPGVKPNINDIYENIQTSLFGNERKDGLLRFIDGQLFFYPLEGNEKEIASRVDRYLANIPLVNLYKIEEEGKQHIGGDRSSSPV